MDLPDKGASADTAGRAVDDETAEARERIGRIESSAGGAATEAQHAAQDTEERLPEREAVEQQAAPSEREFETSLKNLEGASRDLKGRIDEERRRHDMPIDSALGNPEIEERNADGRNDLPDRDED